MKRYFTTIALASSFMLSACGGSSDSSGNSNNGSSNSGGSVTIVEKPVNNMRNSKHQAWLDAHNTYRRKHQVGDVKWSDTIAKSAQNFVDRCPSGHSNSGYGENLAYASYKQTPNKVVGRWYAEESKHDYSKGYQGNSGHFSQIVWKNTTEIGCAQASNCGGAWADIVVCQYNPAGNYLGQFGENVLPPK